MLLTSRFSMHTCTVSSLNSSVQFNPTIFTIIHLKITSAVTTYSTALCSAEWIVAGITAIQAQTTPACWARIWNPSFKPGYVWTVVLREREREREREIYNYKLSLACWTPLLPSQWLRIQNTESLLPYNCIKDTGKITHSITTSKITHSITHKHKYTYIVKHRVLYLRSVPSDYIKSPQRCDPKLTSTGPLMEMHIRLATPMWWHIHNVYVYKDTDTDRYNYCYCVMSSHSIIRQESLTVSYWGIYSVCTKRQC